MFHRRHPFCPMVQGVLVQHRGGMIGPSIPAIVSPGLAGLHFAGGSPHTGIYQEVDHDKYLELQLCAVCHDNPRAPDAKRKGEFHPTCSSQCGRFFNPQRKCIVCKYSDCARNRHGDFYPTCGINCGRVYKRAILCSFRDCINAKECRRDRRTQKCMMMKFCSFHRM